MRVAVVVAVTAAAAATAATHYQHARANVAAGNPVVVEVAAVVAYAYLHVAAAQVRMAVILSQRVPRLISPDRRR